MFIHPITEYIHACECVLVSERALASTVCLCVCVCDTFPFACECSTLLQAEQRNPQGAQIQGISKTSLASAVTMAKAAGGTPVFKSALYRRQVQCIHQL